MYRWSLILAVSIGVGYVCGIEDELFCKDPDTKEYHPVNSTWRSSSFCGNYTCKIRTKNNTATEYIPLEKEDHISKEDKARKIIADLRDAFHETVSKDPIAVPDVANDVCYKCNEVVESEDRYLTTEEVNSIAKFLYSVKKSDLDILLDMYKIANDLYGEMETSATEDTPQSFLTAPVFPDASQTPQSFPSYYPLQTIPKPSWYNQYYQDYYNQFNPKSVSTYPYSYPVEYSTPEYPPKFANRASTLQLQTLTPQTLNRQVLPTQLFSQSEQVEVRQPLDHLDGMGTAASEVYSIPYPFYPNVPYLQAANFKYPLLVSVPTDRNAEHYNPFGLPDVSETVRSRPSNTNSEEILKHYPEVMLTNYSPPPQVYYNFSTNPYTQYIPVQYVNMNYFNPDQTFNNVEGSVDINRIKPQSNSNIGETMNEVPTNDHLKKQFPWKSPSLSENTLESVRAHVIQKQPSLLARPRRLQPGVLNPLKRIKLERIGKVVRLDELKRTRRDADDKITEKVIEEEIKHITQEIKEVKEEIQEITVEKNNHQEEEKKEENDTMETYIITTGCELDTEPGYFRAGDASLPFPQCCPQRLEDKLDK